MLKKLSFAVTCFYSLKKIAESSLNKYKLRASKGLEFLLKVKHLEKSEFTMPVNFNERIEFAFYPRSAVCNMHLTLTVW